MRYIKVTIAYTTFLLPITKRNAKLLGALGSAIRINTDFVQGEYRTYKEDDQTIEIGFKEVDLFESKDAMIAAFTKPDPIAVDSTDANSS